MTAVPSASERPRTGRTLAARDISLAFGGVSALRNASLHIEPGRITGILGPNGAGKSTLFNVLAGNLQPDSGTVLLDGEDITCLAVHRRARIGIARTFQLSRELGSLTVLENLMLASPAHPGEAIRNVFFRRGVIRRVEEESQERAMALLRRVRLASLADESAGHLSGGQKKLLELCRALMLQPDIILLDEPAAGVNPAMIGELVDFIRLLKAEGHTFAIVEHNMDMVAALCDWVYVLTEGQVLTQGSFATVTADAQVQRAYLGEGI